MVNEGAACGATATTAMGSVYATRDGTATTRLATSSMYGRAPPGSSTTSRGSGGRRKAGELFAPVERRSSTSGRGELIAWCVACGAFVFILVALASAQEIYSRLVHRPQQQQASSTRHNSLGDAVSHPRAGIRAPANLTGNGVASNAGHDTELPIPGGGSPAHRNDSSRQ
ncbi:hypothetical protein HPB51_007682 [Rhipicephalus microplus]|uniref:Uncharacterized protein n=1 Tax=Rhipicephalus microplus TaxID=6941 RepID=A0A9J6DU02_RHIMP|nr:hypothetical protein HPB51_007682 [Rhipicephalus microplus]